MKKVKYFVTLVLLFVFCIGAVPVQAATGINTGDIKINLYPCTNVNFAVYDGTGDTKKQIGICFYNDYVTLHAVYTNGFSIISYPVPGGSKTGYCKTENLFQNPDFDTTRGTTMQNITTYTTSACRSKFGVSEVGDVCWIVGYDEIKGATQLLYSCKNYFKVGWLKGVYEINSNGELVKKVNVSTSSSPFARLVGSTVDDIDSLFYTSENISYMAGYKGQCTWFCYGRMNSVNGIKLKSAPNAKYWLSANSSDSRVEVVYGGWNIRPKSIAVRTSGTWGHVMFIEDVVVEENGTTYVYFTEANADGNGRYDAGIDCIVQKLELRKFIEKKKPAGYIVPR